MRQAEVDENSNKYQTYLEFAQRIEQMKAENSVYLEAAKQAGKTIWGFVAPVKGNILLNYFIIGTQYLDYLVEKNKLRRGLVSPGMHIPLLIEKELTCLPDIYYVLAWNFKRETLANNQGLVDQGGEFFFPVNPPDA